MLDGVEARFAFRVEIAVAIRVDDTVDEVGIVERWGGAVVGGVAEAPRRRPLLPQ